MPELFIYFPVRKLITDIQKTRSFLKGEFNPKTGKPDWIETANKIKKHHAIPEKNGEVPKMFWQVQEILLNYCFNSEQLSFYKHSMS